MGPGSDSSVPRSRIPHRAGRRKPFIAVGAVAAANALVAVFAPPAGAGAIYLGLWYALLYVAWSLVMAGTGLKHGIAVGQTNELGTWVTSQEHDIGCLFHTWYRCLGIDPGETVAINFYLQNVGAAPTASLMASIVPGGSATPLGGPQDYGVLIPNGAAVGRTNTFIASGVAVISRFIAP